jgi:peptidoglycan/xylan/chitin deacetylase (PgdA/CDA1 family)
MIERCKIFRAKKWYSHFIKLFVLIWVFLIFAKTGNALEIAITIDDLPLNGPLPPNVTRMDIANAFLNTFEKHHIKGVYGFVIGKRMDEVSEGEKVLKAWVKAGHRLGNHTYSHKDLIEVTAQQYIEDIRWDEPYFINYMGSKDQKYFRYPYLSEGDTAEKYNAVHDFLSAENYIIAPVSLFFSDYLWDEPYVRCIQKNDKNAIQWLEKTYVDHVLFSLNSFRRLSNTLLHREIKYILLIHFNILNARMLDKVLTIYESQGAKFISLPEALKDNIYQEKNIHYYVYRKYPTYLERIANMHNVDLIAQGLRPDAGVPDRELKKLCM